MQASGEAAVRFPFQDGQRVARSGRAERVADMRRPVSVAGRPQPAEFFDSVNH